MSATREVVREKARVARDLSKNHPLMPELSAGLFAQKGISAFRFSAALIEWSRSELEGLQKIWVQAYKNAWHVPWSSANSLYTFPTAEGGHECLLPSGVLTQGPLIIATADIDFENFQDDPICGLTLQTNPLSMFNVYPLHVFKHEPNDFFQKCGYDRLSLYFALLYTVCTGRSMAILCENPITSYILFIYFRSGMKPQTVDMHTNIAMYFVPI